MSTLLIDHWRTHATEQLMAIVGHWLPNKAEYRRFLAAMTTGEFLREWREAMQDADNEREPYKVIGANLISVCANCFPGDSITKFFPDLKGVNISHGICPGHKRRFMLGLKAPALVAAHTETATSLPHEKNIHPVAS